MHAHARLVVVRRLPGNGRKIGDRQLVPVVVPFADPLYDMPSRQPSLKARQKTITLHPVIGQAIAGAWPTVGPDEIGGVVRFIPADPPRGGKIGVGALVGAQFGPGVARSTRPWRSPQNRRASRLHAGLEVMPSALG